MPTVTALKTLFLNQVAPGDPAEFLRLLTEADMRLLEFGRWSFTRRSDTLVPVNGIVTLPTTYASILGARVDKAAVEIRDFDYEFVPGGRGEVEIGSGSSRLIDQGMVDVEFVESSLMVVNGTGPFTDGFGDPETVDGLEFYEHELENGRMSYWPYAEPPIFISGSYSVIRWTGSQWEMKTGFPSGGYFFRVYSNEDVETPDLVNNWTLDTSGVYALATGTVDSITQEGGTYTEPRRQYKVAGYLADDDVITALMHFAPVTLMDPAIADSMTPEDATIHTRCPNSAALKNMMLGIRMEEAHDHGGARSFIADALKILDNTEQTQRGNATRTINSRPMGMGVRKVRSWR